MEVYEEEEEEDEQVQGVVKERRQEGRGDIKQTKK